MNRRFRNNKKQAKQGVALLQGAATHSQIGKKDAEQPASLDEVEHAISGPTP